MLKQFGLHKDIEVYKRLLDVMPKGKMVPKNYFQEMSVYYAKHQATAIQLLDYMSQNHVAPDKELEAMVGRIFGDRSMVWRKVARMNYWMAKWYRSSPFPLPEKLPNESLDLAKFVLKRICPDIQTRIHTYQTAVLEDCLDQTWIVSAQSPVQRDIVTTLAEPLYVEGPFECVLNESRIGYFVLRTGPPKRFTVPTEDPDPFDVSNLKFDLFGGSNKTGAIAATQNLHKQSDGTIIALCCTGTSSRDSLLSWIRILEHLDPNLKKLKVIFKLKAPSPTDMVHVKQQSYSPMTSDLNSNQKGA